MFEIVHLRRSVDREVDSRKKPVNNNPNPCPGEAAQADPCHGYSVQLDLRLI